MRNLISYIALSTLLAISCAVGQEDVDGPHVRPQGDADAAASGREPSKDGGGHSSNGSGGQGIIASPGWDASAGNTPGDPAACAAETRKAATLPLDIFIMMDQSDSMGATVPGGVQWDLIVSALTQFVNDPGSAGIGVGIQYFGLDGGGFGWFGLSDTTSCKADDYAHPDVPITVLPGGSPVIMDSLHRHGPTGKTPTTPALEGAIRYASTWANEHPTHRAVVLLATDGMPSVCSSTIEEVAQTAKNGADGTPKIPTYVIGVGSLVSNLDQVAAAGGTGKAFMVDTSQDTAKSFAGAMNSIRNAALLPCQFAIPLAKPGDTLDLNKVNVAYTPGAGQSAGKATTIANVPDKTQCDPASGGWFYDDPQVPATVNLCDSTCSAVTADTSGRVDILVGCKTVTVIR